jgi:uncharacterized protein
MWEIRAMTSSSIRFFRSAAIAIFLLASPGLALAAETAPRVLVVSGEGKVTAKPDQAQVTSGVTTQAASAASAMSANSAAMNRVFATLKALGIPETKIQTSGLSVSPQYSNPKPGSNEPARVVGYQVSNEVTITIDDLAKVGPALDALVKSGSNQLNGVSFGIANPAPFAARALQSAVATATMKAKAVAQAAGIALGPIMSIEEGGTSIPRPMPMMRAMAFAAAPAPPPIAEGEETISASVTITYLIQ